jgi:hypothetical protein
LCLKNETQKKMPDQYPSRALFPLRLGVKEQRRCQCKLADVHVYKLYPVIVAEKHPYFVRQSGARHDSLLPSHRKKPPHCPRWEEMLFVGKGFNRRDFLVCKSDGEAAFSGQVDPPV